MTDGLPCKTQLCLSSSAVKTRTKDKYRVVYTDHQRLELEKEFHYSRYITIRRKAELAATLGLSERQVGRQGACSAAWPGRSVHTAQSFRLLEGFSSTSSSLFLNVVEYNYVI